MSANKAGQTSQTKPTSKCPACSHSTSDRTYAGLWLCSNAECDVHTFFPGTLTSIQKLRATAERSAIQEAA